MKSDCKLFIFCHILAFDRVSFCFMPVDKLSSYKLKSVETNNYHRFDMFGVNSRLFKDKEKKLLKMYILLMSFKWTKYFVYQIHFSEIMRYCIRLPMVLIYINQFFILFILDYHDMIRRQTIKCIHRQWQRMEQIVWTKKNVENQATESGKNRVEMMTKWIRSIFG